MKIPIGNNDNNNKDRFLKLHIRMQIISLIKISLFFFSLRNEFY